MFENVRWGARWGVIFGVVMVVFVLLAFLVQGGEPRAVLTDRIGRVVGLALLLGFSGGILVGLLRPVLSLGRTGAAITGFVVAAFLTTAMHIIIDWPALWEQESIIAVFLTAAVLGPTVGIIYYIVFRS